MIDSGSDLGFNLRVTPLPPLPDLTRLSHDQKDALIVARHAQAQALHGQVQTLTWQVAVLQACVAELEAKLWPS